MIDLNPNLIPTVVSLYDVHFTMFMHLIYKYTFWTHSAELLTTFVLFSDLSIRPMTVLAMSGI